MRGLLLTATAALVLLPGDGEGGLGLPGPRRRLGARRRPGPVGRRGRRAARLGLPADPRALLPGHDAAGLAGAAGARAPRRAAGPDRGRLGGAVPARRRGGTEGAREAARAALRRAAPARRAAARAAAADRARRAAADAERRRLPRRAAGQARGGPAARRQHGPPRPLPARRRAVRDADRLERGRLPGAGGRRPLLCARDDAPERGLRPVRRRPQPGLRRHPGRAARDVAAPSARPPARCSPTAAA